MVARPDPSVLRARLQAQPGLSRGAAVTAAMGHVPPRFLSQSGGRDYTGLRLAAVGGRALPHARGNQDPEWVRKLFSGEIAQTIPEPRPDPLHHPRTGRDLNHIHAASVAAPHEGPMPSQDFVEAQKLAQQALAMAPEKVQAAFTSDQKELLQAYSNNESVPAEKRRHLQQMFGWGEFALHRGEDGLGTSTAAAARRAQHQGERHRQHTAEIGGPSPFGNIG